MNIAPSQAWFRPNPQALALFVLAINGTVALYQRQIVWWQWGSVAIILVLGLCHVLNRPFKVLPITLEFFLVLALTVALMLSTGGTSSFFLAWLFILALYYPLQLPAPLAAWTPFIIGTVYLALAPFSPATVPVAIVLARSLLLATVGWSIYDLARRLEHVNQQQKKSLETLEQNRHYIHDLSQTIPGITYVASQDGTFFISPQVEAILGYSPQEFIEDKTFWDTCLHPDDYEAVMALLNKKYEPGELLTCEYRMIAKDGRTLWFRDEARVERDDEGYIRELQGIMLEITQRKEYEAQLSYQASLVNNMVDAVISTDQHDTIITLNKAAEQLYGYTQSEAQGKTVGELLRSEYPTTTKEAMLHEFTTRGFWLGEVVQTSKTGERLPILASVSKVSDKAGNYIGTVAINKDMRGAKQAQLALQTSEHRYRDLLEQAAEGILVTDQHLQLILVNQTLCELLGFSETELLQMKTPDLIHEENLKQFPLQTDAIRRGEIVKSERLLKRKDGSSILVEGSAKLLSDGSIQTILRDIGERKRAEETLQKTEAFYRAITEKSNEGVMVLDKDLVVRYRHAPQPHVSTYSNEEFLGFNRTDLIHPEDLKHFQQRLTRLPPAHTLIHNFRIRNQKGDWDWFEGMVTNLRDNPAVNGYVVNYHNINERKYAQEALERTEAFYRTITEKSHEGILVFDKDLMIQYHTPSHLPTTSVAYNDLAHQHHTDLINPKHAREFLQTLLPLGPGKTVSDIFQMQTIDGQWNWFESRVTNLLHDPVINGYVANYYVINERKQAEDERRELSVRLTRIQEEERRSLARELHDEIGQSLTAIKVGLQNAQHLHKPEALGEVVHLADTVLTQVRELSLNLHPHILEDLGLSAALRWHIMKQAEAKGFKVNLDIWLQEITLTSELETSIYRITQEALTNIIRHAQAKHVYLAVGVQGKSLVLTIKDDGQGFDTTTMTHSSSKEGLAFSKGSLGLVSMRERAKLQGGKLELFSLPGQGTEVVATFPLPLKGVTRGH